MDKIDVLNIKVEAAKKGWDWAMNFCNNLCVQISDDYNNDDQIEQAEAATECYRKIQANMGYYPTDIETAEWKENQATMDLQLPVLFARWVNETQRSFDSANGWKDIETGYWSNEEDLFDNWFQNIYTPNQKI